MTTPTGQAEVETPIVDQTPIVVEPLKVARREPHSYWHFLLGDMMENGELDRMGLMIPDEVLTLKDGEATAAVAMPDLQAQ